MADSQAPAWGGPVRFGKYELVSLLGTGGMAEVFLARAGGPRNFERLLVVKRMLPHLSRNEEFVEMFVEEAKLSALLYHGNIVQVFEFGEIDGQLFLAMEHIDGTDLRTLLKARSEPLPAHVASYVAMQTLLALSYAHTRCALDGGPLGIVHRDVNPANILLSRTGEVKLCDFGIAKVATRHTSSGSLKGKFGYMSPEQVRGEVVDSRTDLFAVGVVLWEMLAGKRLFVSENDVATLEKVRAAEVPELAHLTSAADRRLRGTVRRALQRDPAKRHADAKAFAEELRQHIVTSVAGDPMDALRELVAQIPGGMRGPAPSSSSGVVESRDRATVGVQARSEAVTAIEPASMLDPLVTTLPGVQPPTLSAPAAPRPPDVVPPARPSAPVAPRPPGVVPPARPSAPVAPRPPDVVPPARTFVPVVPSQPDLVRPAPPSDSPTALLPDRVAPVQPPQAAADPLLDLVPPAPPVDHPAAWPLDLAPPARPAAPRRAMNRRLWIVAASTLLLLATGAVLLVLALRPVPPPLPAPAVLVPPRPAIDPEIAATSEVPAPPLAPALQRGELAERPPPGASGLDQSTTPAAAAASNPGGPGVVAAPLSAVPARSVSPAPLAAPARAPGPRTATAGPRATGSPQRAAGTAGDSDEPSPPGREQPARSSEPRSRPPTKERMIDPFALGSDR